MSETAKTCAFVAAGVLAIASAVFLDSKADAPDMGKLVGGRLNEDIDLAAPRRMQIVKFDRQTASVRRFEVAELDGIWSIPSKDNYPADAIEQMAAATTSLMDRKILRVAGDSGQSHEEFGVVDPLAEKLDSRSLGVGTHVIMTDADDAVLIDMIIGKAVKDSPTQRYVRRARQDVVYVVELDPSHLTTDFADWIEDDLLKLNTMDLRQVFINDYTAELGLGVGANGRPVLTVDRRRRGEFTLKRDADGSPWTVAKILKGDPEQLTWVDDAVAADEEINQEAVNGLVTGLDDLLIVDVARKPAGLSADLKAGEAFLNEREAVSDLMDKGFIPNPEQQSGAELLSSEGEVICTLRNGVEYVLRFGQLVESESQAGDSEEGAAETPSEGETPATDAEKSNGQNLQRYLFVTTRFNEDAVEKPEYKDSPELPADDASAGDEAADEDPESTNAAEGSADDAPAEGEESAAAGADAEQASEQADADEAEADEEDAADGDADASDDAAEDESGEADADEEKSQAEKDRDAIVAERKRIEEENDRAREEYESLMSAGQKEVATLNERFGDWYYVISNDVYKKIHLGREQVVKKKETPAAEGEAAAGAAEATAPPSETEALPDIPAE